MTTHPERAGDGRTRVDSREPLGGYPLIDTSDIGEAEARGEELLSRYRLDVSQQLSFNARVNGCTLGGVDLYYTNFGRTEVDIASAPLADRYGIVIPLSGTMRLRYKSQEFEVASGSSAVIVSPDADFRMRWSDGFESLTVRVTKSSLAAAVRSLVPQADGDAVSFDPVIGRPATLHSIRGSLRLLYECVARVGTAEDVPPALANRAREQLVTTLLMMQPNVISRQLYEPTVRIGHRPVRAAVELIQADAGSIGTVAELARRVGVTARSLQIGFQRELGVSPAAYLHDVRLDRAHQELLDAEPGSGTTVGDVALRWGFQHAGRFAVYYRRRFGETPSQTRRQRAC